MLSDAMKSLVRSSGAASRLGTAIVASFLAAVAVPVIAVILGEIVQLLIVDVPRTELSDVSHSQISPWLPDLSIWLPTGSRLGHITILLGAALFVIALAAIALFIFYRQLQIVAVEFEVCTIARLREHARSLATSRTLSAQQTALFDCLEYHLPRVRACLSRWWRAYPRHLFQFAACLIVACLIQFTLTALTLVAVVMGVIIFRFVESRKRTALPVIRERAAQQREELTNLSLKGPLLESVQSKDVIDSQFNEQLALYRRDAVRSLANSAWRMPTLSLVAGACGGLFIFVIAVQILQSEIGFSVASALAFILCLGGATLSILRLQKSRQDLRHVEAAAIELNSFLSLQSPEIAADGLFQVQRIVAGVALEHITLQDSSGSKLLEDISLDFKHGRLIGIVSTQKLQDRALVELLLGYGRPTSGRVMIDDRLITDIEPASVTQASHWVSADGGISTGTLRENLVGPSDKFDQEALEDAAVRAKIKETVSKLSDGYTTLLTSTDDRLQEDEAFRIGLARATLRNPSLVVVEEPAKHVQQEEEEATLAAIRGLVASDRITVVLPQRLATIRSCDTVILLHESRVHDQGTHTELVQRNELYRHLNYLRFNPFRSMQA